MTMRAATQTRYGLDAIEIGDRPIPEPGPAQVRVRIEAAAINPADWHMASGRPSFLRLTEGLRTPRKEILGADMAGVVDAVGEGSTWRVGDEVFGGSKGAFAEFGLCADDRIATRPAGMSFAEAAGLPIAGVTALQAVEHAAVEGKRVVVNGASGGVGHYAIQIAKASGASHVAGVCSASNVAMVNDLGADEVYDYATDDFTADRFDAVIDCAGSRTGSEIRRCLTPEGRWVLLGPPKGGRVLGPLPFVLRQLSQSLFSKTKTIAFVAEETDERLRRLGDLVRNGQLQTVIDKEYGLADLRTAFDHVESARARGKLIIRV